MRWGRDKVRCRFLAFARRRATEPPPRHLPTNDSPRSSHLVRGPPPPLRGLPGSASRTRASQRPRTEEPDPEPETGSDPRSALRASCTRTPSASSDSGSLRPLAQKTMGRGGGPVRRARPCQSPLFSLASGPMIDERKKRPAARDTLAARKPRRAVPAPKSVNRTRPPTARPLSCSCRFASSGQRREPALGGGSVEWLAGTPEPFSGGVK